MNLRFALLALVLSFGSAHISDAVTFGQVDNFQDGTLAGWTNNAGNASNIADGGPGGSGDHFLEVFSTGGSGPGSRLTIFNNDQWTGDYIGAGVTAIEVDLRNEGAVQLSIRIAFKRDNSFSAPGYLSAAFLLPADAIWHHVVFLIMPGSMIPVGGPTPFSTFFSGTGPGEMRIINEVGTSNLNGDPIIAQMGVDNIRAVPEPRAWVLFGLAAIPFALAMRRRRA